MKRKVIWIIAVVVVIVCSFFASRMEGKPSAWGPQLQARCAVNVPKAWGEYIDSGSLGLVFRDSEGTLRFVDQLPCGLDGEPHVSLAVRRN